MNLEIEYLINKASLTEITEHLLSCDADFVPRLSARVNIKAYAKRIAGNAIRIEAWTSGTLIGLVAVYCNDLERGTAYITSVSVLRAWVGKGIATRLVSRCIEQAKASQMKRIGLEVSKENAPAIKLYEKSGFIIGYEKLSIVTMNQCLENREENERHV